VVCMEHDGEVIEREKIYQLTRSRYGDR
jgi:hypothetical protein